MRDYLWGVVGLLISVLLSRVSGRVTVDGIHVFFMLWSGALSVEVSCG